MGGLGRTGFVADTGTTPRCLVPILLASRHARDHEDLLGRLIELLNALRGLARFDFERGSALRPLDGEDVLCLMDGCRSFEVARLKQLRIPCNVIISAPR